jgi:cardiolipin synthase
MRIRDASIHEQAAEPTLTTNVWTVANVLSFFRIALVFPFLYLIVEGRFGLALAVFFIASATDFVDGYVARRFKQQSSLGRFLDPLADKLLTTAAFVALAVPRSAFPTVPVWLAAIVVGRDLLIVAGALFVYSSTGVRTFKPTFLGKVNTLFELGLIVWFLVFHTTGKLIFLLPALYAIVALSVAASSVEYTILGLKMLRSRQ